MIRTISSTYYGDKVDQYHAFAKRHGGDDRRVEIRPDVWLFPDGAVFISANPPLAEEYKEPPTDPVKLWQHKFDWAKAVYQRAVADFKLLKATLLGEADAPFHWRPWYGERPTEPVDALRKLVPIVKQLKEDALALEAETPRQIRAELERKESLKRDDIAHRHREEARKVTIRSITIE